MSKVNKQSRRKAATAALTAEEEASIKLDNQLCFPLYAASRLMTNAYRPFLAELGLTYPQYLVLLVLWEQDGLSVSEIGARLFLDSGTLTPLLKRLAQQGFIERRRSEADDRVVGNWLTSEGLALKKRAVHIPNELLCAARLDVSTATAIKLVLDRLIAALLPIQDLEQGRSRISSRSDPRVARR